MQIRVGSMDLMTQYGKILHLKKLPFPRTSPEVAYERLRKRGRAEEAGVPMDFIKVRHLVSFIQLSPLILYNVQKLYILLEKIVGSKPNIKTKKNRKPMPLLMFWLNLLHISKPNILRMSPVPTRSFCHF
jgi:hypothetical protein